MHRKQDVQGLILNSALVACMSEVLGTGDGWCRIMVRMRRLGGCGMEWDDCYYYTAVDLAYGSLASHGNQT
jgi:hypothetical protein